MRENNVEGCVVFISDDGQRISFYSGDIKEYETKQSFDKLYDDFCFEFGVCDSEIFEVFVKEYSESFLNYYKCLGLIKKEKIND